MAALRASVAIAAVASLVAGGTPPAAAAPGLTITGTWQRVAGQPDRGVGACVAAGVGYALVVITDCGVGDPVDRRSYSAGPVAVATFTDLVYGYMSFCYSAYGVPIDDPSNRVTVSGCQTIYP